MRGLSAVAILLSGCQLLTPFDVDDLRHAPDADGDGDTGVDAGSDGDADTDGDADADADQPPFDYAAGCTGGAAEERWAVSTQVGGELVSYLTGRDCAAPIEVCRGCYLASISPSGQRAVVVRPNLEGARTLDWLGLLDLEPLAALPTDIGRQGTAPAWLDDESFYYVGLGEPPCVLGVTPAQHDQIRLWVGSGAPDVVLDFRPRRSSLACCLLPSGDGSRLAFQEGKYEDCRNFDFGLRLLAIEEPAPTTPFLTDDGGPDFPFALLPRGDGFLVQRFEARDSRTSRLYAVPLEGRPAPLLDDPLVTTVDGALLYVVEAAFPSCANVGRLGPACEYYCRLDTDGQWHRMSLASREPGEAVDCSEVGAEVRITAVWQR